MLAVFHPGAPGGTRGTLVPIRKENSHQHDQQRHSQLLCPVYMIMQSLGFDYASAYVAIGELDHRVRSSRRCGVEVMQETPIYDHLIQQRNFDPVAIMKHRADTITRPRIDRDSSQYWNLVYNPMFLLGMIPNFHRLAGHGFYFGGKYSGKKKGERGGNQPSA